MSKVYKVTGHNMVFDYRVDEWLFSSKSKAEKSAKNLIDYLIRNNDLNENAITKDDKKGLFNNPKTIWYLDNKYSVTLSEHTVYKTEVKI